jgi:hypothetical protein
MSAIWKSEGAGWKLLAPDGFPDEDSLHSLVEAAPQLLPLSGEPLLVVVGREVVLGAGTADLVAVEPSGRLAIIEIKLKRNSEARRAVVAQVLTYAAHLHGLDPEAVERDVLGTHLRSREYTSLADAVMKSDQHGSFDPDAFSDGLAVGLSSGRLRLVLVLDEAPEELMSLVGYLEAVAENLLIDLVTIAAYEVDGVRILVPQRVEPERVTPPDRAAGRDATKSSGFIAEGAEDFLKAIEASPTQHREGLRQLTDWALALERERLVRLQTYHGKGRMTLLPRLLTENVGLVTIWNDGGPYLQLWRSVFERRAPEHRPSRSSAGCSARSWETTRNIDPGLLEALTDAYREAASS